MDLRLAGFEMKSKRADLIPFQKLNGMKYVREKNLQ